MRGITALVIAIAAAAPGGLPARQGEVPPPAENTLAFDDSAQRMTVPVTIGTTGPFPFIIDTGAERTVISRELAATLGLSPGPDVRMTAMTGTSNVGTVVIPSLNVSNILSQRIEAPALYSINLGAPGMLGIDTLSGHALSIDFETNSMTVRPSTKRKRAPVLNGDIVVRARSVYGQLIVTQAYYKGRRISVIVDTGSSVSMGNSVLRARMRGELKAAQPITLTSVTGDRLTADYTQVTSLDIGGVTFNHLPIAFSDVAPFRRFGLSNEPALLLGMDALRLFRKVEVDFANREVRFALPRGSRPDAF
ncbi:aspartyl protease family protein [Sphingomonas sp. QA11]|uniref:aspartyl protease family protein n=1 Tax=Sphingomonas sp. QA11 TaxID=2950605 RepID=UPI00234B759D|nr:aspartyl protease family protein [Sphingomonas sp. QA11]WCM26386.1 aspartyl protease family protein [Sphingomonas sp. QA11]